MTGGIALLVALAWTGYRMAGQQGLPAAPPAPTAVARQPSRQPASQDLHNELAGAAIDDAISRPKWTRQALMDRLTPFDPSIAEPAPAPAVAPPDTAGAPQDVAEEIPLRLEKGETIARALQKLGIASNAIAAVSSALAAHVSLKRLPAGLAMTAQIQRQGGANPILHGLTIRPKGREAITVGRDEKGNYAVEQRSRSTDG